MKRKISSVSADRNKIRQVVSNLMDNSIKYTPGGFIKVSLSKIPENGNVCYKIEDSGIGISAETMPNLFQKNSAGPRASFPALTSTAQVSVSMSPKK